MSGKRKINFTVGSLPEKTLVRVLQMFRAGKGCKAVGDDLKQEGQKIGKAALAAWEAATSRRDIEFTTFGEPLLCGCPLPLAAKKMKNVKWETPRLRLFGMFLSLAAAETENRSKRVGTRAR